MEEILDIRNTNRKKNAFDGQMFKQTGHCQGNISKLRKICKQKYHKSNCAFHLTYTIIYVSFKALKLESIYSV